MKRSKFSEEQVAYALRQAAPDLSARRRKNLKAHWHDPMKRRVGCSRPRNSHSGLTLVEAVGQPDKPARRPILRE